MGLVEPQLLSRAGMCSYSLAQVRRTKVCAADPFKFDAGVPAEILDLNWIGSLKAFLPRETEAFAEVSDVANALSSKAIPNLPRDELEDAARVRDNGFSAFPSRFSAIESDLSGKNMGIRVFIMEGNLLVGGILRGGINFT
jgi:hypothetical protein